MKELGFYTNTDYSYLLQTIAKALTIDCNGRPELE